MFRIFLQVLEQDFLAQFFIFFKQIGKNNSIYLGLYSVSAWLIVDEAKLVAFGLWNRPDEERKVALLNKHFNPFAPFPLPFSQNFSQLCLKLVVPLKIPQLV